MSILFVSKCLTWPPGVHTIDLCGQTTVEWPVRATTKANQLKKATHVRDSSDGELMSILFVSKCLTWPARVHTIDALRPDDR